jgi:hypothetical protein
MWCKLGITPGQSKDVGTYSSAVSKSQQSQNTETTKHLKEVEVVSILSASHSQRKGNPKGDHSNKI